ncbi:DUF2637 domain-containing protein [Modestobacter sp. KNN46-3]|uniref:DUF2637 domain-containing protein n=1 Tax=Modestobacter sp. KNN46-3 TaxID=2711218 RepID=UPI0013DF34FD|nr:DUF2637 domain-containing protein [Modestobacter sp. KNN46-3]
MSTTTIAHPIASEQTIARIGRLMILASVLIASCAAVLSYDALRLLAMAQGVPATLAWMFPLILDGTIAAASLATLYATLRGQRGTYPWLLVLGFTTFSLLGNVMHGQQTPVGWFVAALPPVGFALVWHLLISHRQHEIVRAAEVAEAARLAAEREEERQRRAEERAARTTQAAVSAPVPRRAPESTRTSLRVAEVVEPNVTAAQPTSPGPARPKVSEALLSAAREIVASEPGIRAVDLGARLGKSEKTGRNLLRALEAQGSQPLVSVG